MAEVASLEAERVFGPEIASMTTNTLSTRKDRRVEDERLSRMEVKLDALADAMKDLIIVQRDMHHLVDRIARVEDRQDKFEDKLNIVSKSETRSSASSDMFVHVALVVFSSAVAILGTLIFSRGSAL
jgi:molybdenum cofactor biosynthesis enzyme MoaA